MGLLDVYNLFQLSFFFITTGIFLGDRAYTVVRVIINYNSSII